MPDEESKDIVKVESSALAPFASRDAVREMTERIKIMLPGGEKYTMREVRALAQVSVAHGLDPFNGEIWYLKTDTGKSLGIMIGIKGLRKKAHEQVKGNYWITYEEMIDEDWRKRHRIPQGALCYEARLWDSETIRTYTDMVKEFKGSGIPWEVIQGMVGEKPYTTGIGVLGANDKTYMEPVQCVMKRAESNAIKQRFDVDFGYAVDDGSGDEFLGEWALTEEAEDQDGDDPPVCLCGCAMDDHGSEGLCVSCNDCSGFKDVRLEKGKKALGRDGGGID